MSAAEAQATVLAGAVIPIAARASGGGRPLRLDRPCRRGGCHPSPPRGSKWIAPAHPAARAHQRRPGSFEVTVELFQDVATIVTLEVIGGLLSQGALRDSAPAASARLSLPRAHHGVRADEFERFCRSTVRDGTRARLIRTVAVARTLGLLTHIRFGLAFPRPRAAE